MLVTLGITTKYSCDRYNEIHHNNYVDDVSVEVVEKDYHIGRKHRTYRYVTFMTECGNKFTKSCSKNEYDNYQEGSHYYVNNVRKDLIGKTVDDMERIWLINSAISLICFVVSFLTIAGIVYDNSIHSKVYNV